MATDLFPINPHAAYYIKGIVNSYPVKFMLDTGAAVCKCLEYHKRGSYIIAVE